MTGTPCIGLQFDTEADAWLDALERPDFRGRMETIETYVCDASPSHAHWRIRPVVD